MLGVTVVCIGPPPRTTVRGTTALGTVKEKDQAAAAPLCTKHHARPRAAREGGPTGENRDAHMRGGRRARWVGGRGGPTLSSTKALEGTSPIRLYFYTVSVMRVNQWRVITRTGKQITEPERRS